MKLLALFFMLLSKMERSIRLYKKHGFESIGVYKSYFKIDEKYVDFKLMNLYFN